MPERLPIIYTVEHASHDFGEYANRTSLTAEQRVRYSDYGTADTVPRNGQTIVSTHSRGLVDLNRAPNNPELYPTFDFAKPTPNTILVPGQEPSYTEIQVIYESIYHKYHKGISDCINSLNGNPTLLISCHNTAHYEIGKDKAGN